MKTYTILLRAVTPSGKNKVPMAQLRQVLIEAGFKNVRTYIQSGNVVADSDLTPPKIENFVHDLIQEYIGPNLTVVVHAAADMQRILHDNPFQDGYDAARVFFVLFAHLPSSEKVAVLMAQDFGDEKLVIAQDCAYMYIPGAYGKGTLNSAYLEKQLGVSATMRNFNTMRKLSELSRPE